MRGTGKVVEKEAERANLQVKERHLSTECSDNAEMKCKKERN